MIKNVEKTLFYSFYEEHRLYALHHTKLINE